MSNDKGDSTMNTIDLQHKIGEQLNFCDTKNDRGIKFRFVVIETGRAYGRDCCLINNDAPMVEVWDKQMPQFISRYYISTLLEGRAFDNGINLYGGEPAWQIEAHHLTAVKQWMQAMSDTLNKETAQ